MATERIEKIEVAIIVDRIQFERCGNKACLCGNSHQEAAEKAWLDLLAEAGVDGQIGHGTDTSKHQYFITEFVVEDEGTDEEDRRTRVWWPSCHGPSRDAHKDLTSAHDGLTPSAEVIAAWRAAEEAEFAAAQAADDAADEDCSTTDEDRERDEQADYWLGEMRREAAGRERAARINAIITSLPYQFQPAIFEKLAHAIQTAACVGQSDLSRSARKRMWRSIRAMIGAEETEKLQAAITGFAKRN